MADSELYRAKALLEKFHAGKCTPEELDLLESWYGQLGEEQTQPLAPGKADQYKQQFLTTYRSRLDTHKTVWLSARPARWMVAAAIAVLLSLAYLWMPPPHTTRPQVAGKKDFRINNETSHIRQITLPDSTVVWLNANTVVTWKEDDNNLQRRVTLLGEAYFDVRHDSHRPFIVETPALNIRVLGTAFNVEAYQQEKMTRVSLDRGSVKLTATKDTSLQAQLRPGYAASLTGGHTALVVQKVTEGLAGGWKNGGFSVTNVPLRGAVQRLCSRYGYKVQWNNDSGLHKQLSITLASGSFEQVLGSLCYMSHKQYRITGKQVTIY